MLVQGGLPEGIKIPWRSRTFASGVKGYSRGKVLKGKLMPSYERPWNSAARGYRILWEAVAKGYWIIYWYKQATFVKYH
jgi:hypothetical protein